MVRSALLGIVLLQLAPAQDIFSTTIQPVLKKDCLGCHGESQVLAKLDLRTREAALAGGARGPAIQPGNADASLLYQMIAGKGPARMPPAGPPLDPTIVAAFRDWINAGASWAQGPRAIDKWSAYKAIDLWAFRPLARVPNEANPSIDDFINRKLAEKGLTPAPRADRRTLIRRATIDLTGLPPTPDEVEAFVNDKSADAFARLVDRLLASPRYGERWGRHWLDVARYADTSGYSNDFERPNAWRYRDYVIRAFNQDKPYDRFILEQIAGDELYPGDTEALIATGFLRAGPWEHTGMSVEAVTRQMFLDDVTHGVASTFLGLTLGCARCHDHKFDPLPTKDYYRMQAVFSTTEFARPKADFLKWENTNGLDEGRKLMNTVVARTQSELKRFDDRAVENAMRKHGVAKPEDLPKGVAAQAKRDKEGLGPAEFEEYKLYQKHMQLYRESLDRYEAKAFAVSSGPWDGFTDGGPNLKYPAKAEYKAPEVHVLPGGNIESPADKVEPGVLSLVERYSGFAAPEIPQTVAGRRAALAKWIADPRNPLTARVIVNRVWQYHFGRGIAADTSNFGKMGGKPSHPELLDALAAGFISDGWSIKTLHRKVMLSDAWQRASTHPKLEEARGKDPENRLLAYYSPRRVEAEVVRDSILAVSGELSLEGGGPGVYPQINEDVARQPQHRMGSLAPAYHPSARKADRNRRTVYTFQQRSLMDPMVEVFNGPSLDLSCERRDATTVPTQAFALFNSQFVHDMALAFAARLDREAATPAARIERAFALAYGRKPSASESKLTLAHLASMVAHHRTHAAPEKKPKQPLVHMITSELTGEQHRFIQQDDPAGYEENLHPSEASVAVRALADVTLALLNSNEFVYVY